MPKRSGNNENVNSLQGVESKTKVTDEKSKRRKVVTR